MELVVLFFFAVLCLIGLSVPVLFFWTLIECVVSPYSTGSDKIVWVLIMLSIPLLGSLLYLFLQRPKQIIAARQAQYAWQAQRARPQLPPQLPK